LVLVCNAVDVAHDKGSSSCAIRRPSLHFTNAAPLFSTAYHSLSLMTTPSHSSPPPSPPLPPNPAQRRGARVLQVALGCPRRFAHGRQVLQRHRAHDPPGLNFSFAAGTVFSLLSRRSCAACTR
jgi:hypothetical protein